MQTMRIWKLRSERGLGDRVNGEWVDMLSCVKVDGFGDGRWEMEVEDGG